MLPVLLQAQQSTVLFKNGINNVWVVPQGIKSVTIEGWGGGGGGGHFAGGQGGGYFRVQLSVVPGSQIACAIGLGGQGGKQSGGNGNDTEVNYTEQSSGKRIRFIAQGGMGASSTASTPKGGYDFSSQTLWSLNWSGKAGQPGSVTQTTALTVNTEGQIVWAEAGGNGGDGGASLNSGGFGGSATCLKKQNKPLLTYSVVTNLGSRAATSGIQPAGGGGGIPNLNPSGSDAPIGASGGDGLVIISF